MSPHSGRDRLSPRSTNACTLRIAAGGASRTTARSSARPTRADRARPVVEQVLVADERARRVARRALGEQHLVDPARARGRPRPATRRTSAACCRSPRRGGAASSRSAASTPSVLRRTRRHSGRNHDSRGSLTTMSSALAEAAPSSQRAQLARGPRRRAPASAVCAHAAGRASATCTRALAQQPRVEVDDPLGLGEAARVRLVGRDLGLRHEEAEPLEDPGEEARAAAAGAGDQHERALRSSISAARAGWRHRAVRAVVITRRSNIAARAPASVASRTSLARDASPFARPRRCSARSCCPSCACCSCPSQGGLHERAVAARGARRDPPRTLRASTQPEVSPALTVHDMTLWPPGTASPTTSGAERERDAARGRLAALRGRPRPGATGCVSAWQSKLLLREPRFVEAFGEAPWFPRVPEAPADVVEDFRAFVAARRRAATPQDVHWAVQHDLVAQLPLDHVGRVERMDDTLALLREHVGDDAWPARRSRARTAAPLPLPPGALRRGRPRGAARARTRATSTAFGYDAGRRRRRRELAAWEGARPRCCRGLRDAIDDATRGSGTCTASPSGARGRVARRRAAARGRSAAARPAARAPRSLTNARGPRPTSPSAGGGPRASPRPGFTAVVRVKRRGALAAVGAAAAAARRRARRPRRQRLDRRHRRTSRASVAAEAGAADRLEVHDYPFAIARCGERAPRHARRLASTASPTSTTGRSRTCAPATRSSGTATWC